jgi:hypothetical protein
VELVKHLRLLERRGVITGWHDRNISAGTEWKDAIDNHLESAGIILLLISVDFLASDYCYNIELKRAMERHAEGKARVIPVILRNCDWSSVPFGKLQALPKDGRPVTTWPNWDEACLDVAEGVMRAVRELRGETVTDQFHGQAAGDETRVLEVRVHRAFFSGQYQECYFVNLTNVSPSRVLEVTHVWYEDETQHIPIIQASRPLPVRLDLDQSWETWIESSRLPLGHQHDALSRFRARISTGSVFTSKANPSVPPMGMVPGGPIP